jgi:hypothetical protein
MIERKQFAGKVKFLKYDLKNHEYLVNADGRDQICDPFVSNCLDHDDVFLTGEFECNGFYHTGNGHCLILTSITR